MKTHERVVDTSGPLLVKEGDRVDPLKLIESERLAPSLTRGERRAVYRAPRVSASIGQCGCRGLRRGQMDHRPGGELSSNDGSVAVRDRNLLGFGQRLEQGVSYALGAKQPDLNGQFVVYNIARSYIGTSHSIPLPRRQDQVGVEAHRDFSRRLRSGRAARLSSRTWTHTL